MEHEEVLKTFDLVSKRKVDIASRQTMRDAVGTAGFGHNTTLDSEKDYGLCTFCARSSPY